MSLTACAASVPVAQPLLKPVRTVVGEEVERIVQDGETERNAAARPGD